MPTNTEAPANRTFQVRCGVEMHRLILTKRGALVLADHDAIERRGLLANALMFGRKSECRCVDVLMAWRLWRTGHTLDTGTILPGELKKLRRACKERPCKVGPAHLPHHLVTAGEWTWTPAMENPHYEGCPFATLESRESI